MSRNQNDERIFIVSRILVATSRVNILYKENENQLIKGRKIFIEKLSMINTKKI